MSAPNLPRHERLHELLADRALAGAAGLAGDEARELELLLVDAPPEASEEFELAAAALDLALGPVVFEPMPAGLRKKVEADARAWLAEHERAAPKLVAPRTKDSRAAASARSSNLGWWAAAAAILIALFGWLPRLARPSPPSLEGERLALLERPGVLRAEWQAQPLASGTTGDIVWSNAEQKGFLRLRGLPRNDPKVEQYQLWIVDGAQEHPVDGGVFDAREGGEVVLPIDAKIAVTSPQWFAVTLEKPGGVVVSKQERVALVAKL